MRVKTMNPDGDTFYRVDLMPAEYNKLFPEKHTYPDTEVPSLTVNELPFENKPTLKSLNETIGEIVENIRYLPRQCPHCERDLEIDTDLLRDKITEENGSWFKRLIDKCTYLAGW